MPCKNNQRFHHPEKHFCRSAVFPVFLPFSGCPERCVFCSQGAQTGVSPGTGTAFLLSRAEKALEERAQKARPPLELAFFGGTFTGQSQETMRACLDFAARWKDRGVVTRVRCSTRPDRVDLPLLKDLAGRGLDLVELGVQSFSDKALAASGRNYAGQTARRACALVREAGLGLGVQLMPGMPGLDRAEAEADLEQALDARPDCVRLYPCLVLEDTELARLWRQGQFLPWSLEATLDYLADALLRFWQAGIPVIRMGLAPEDGLDQAVLAGPAHPALGSRARGLALFRHIREQLAGLGFGPESRPGDPPGDPLGGPPGDSLSDRPGDPLGDQPGDPLGDPPGNPPGRHLGRHPGHAADRPLARPVRGVLIAPARCRGEFWGHRKELAPAYAALGLTPKNVRWREGSDDFCLEPDSRAG